ncbi:nucleoside/nucleotide kinase family protein [Gryllotalpicola koreensis]|uniref:Nucleoside/nucleotide kinase family protein n=1 Tax=Gryllotalpicola koreensis TaxID=993086 RepID=A0ABP7ZSZ5_9MICO
MSDGAAIDELVARIRALAAERPRVLIGIAGAPGAGKSTLALALAEGLGERGLGGLGGFGADEVAIVPMDGFHLADVTLERQGSLARKGALDTFDGDGYVAALRRLREPGPRPVYLPGFERELEQPIAAAVAVGPGVRVVLTEGNYLLVGDEPWREVAGLLDECWYVEADDELRRERLVDRHVRFSKSLEHARRWVAEVDERNAGLVRATRGRADLVVVGL